MYNLDNNGIQTPSLSDILQYLENSFKAIYGENIDLSQNTPDGQLINILGQIWVDINSVLVYFYNSINVNTAEGTNLDNLAALHLIKRNKGTYTIVPITIETSQTVELQGLDENYNNVNGAGFTVADNQGNKYILISSTTLEAGQHTLSFRASEIGEQKPALQTINNILTPQLGVISVNNNGAPLQIGTQEESDYNLRQRFFRTEALTGQGQLDNVIANLLDLEGVINVYADENRTNETNKYGTPAHSIWVIIEGGNNDDIAKVINQYISAGCGLRGDIIVPITNIFGNVENIRFDRPTLENLYIKFTATAINGAEIDQETIKQDLVNNLKLSINQTINSNQITCLLQNNNPNIIYTNVELSKDGDSYYDLVKNTNINNIFTLSIDNIEIIEGGDE